jgi:acid phosphatase (class A)
MLSFHRAVLAVGVLAALAAPAAAAAAEAYLTSKDIDLSQFLPPPPPANSPADLAERAESARVQAAATPERVALAKADADETVYVMFGKLLGPKVSASATPLTDRLFARLGETEEQTTGPAKSTFARVRPYMAYPDYIKALVPASKSGSYPSGHTTRVVLEGIILGAMLPEKRADIWARVAEYAESRVVGGMHYPADLIAGRLAGTAEAATLLATPSFRADLDAATKELRAALGL